MVEWMYKTLNSPTTLDLIETAVDLFVASDKYAMDSLKKHCARSLVNHINNLFRWAKEECAELLEYATAIGSSNVAEVGDYLFTVLLNTCFTIDLRSHLRVHFVMRSVSQVATYECRHFVIASTNNV